MSYETFKGKVLTIIEKIGGGVTANFQIDTEKGKYFARCSDGTTITGNPVCLGLTVLFGSGHQAMAWL